MRGFCLLVHMASPSPTVQRSISPLARRVRALASASLLILALLLVQAASASADVFDDLGAGFNGPSISSDKADYSPGETVVLSGSGWLPGEHVHITVNDDVGQTWVRESDVNADAGGSLTDEFQLPDSFIARYAVTAVGDASGTASTTFTDGNLKVASAAGRHFDYTATLFSNGTCAGTGGTPATKTADGNGTTTGVGGNESLLLSANLNANPPNESSTFSNWTTPSPAVQLAAGYSLTDRTICIVGFQSGNRDLIGNYTADGTPPTVTSINRANSNPTNTTGNVSWTVTFSESVTGVDATDLALVNTGLGGTPAITTVTGSAATYTVTASTGTGSGTLRLNLNDNDSIVDAAANKLGGTGTGTVGSGGAGNGSFEGQLYTIDRAAPTIAATAITLPDPPGNTYVADTWTNKSVRVTFTCTDTGGSGKATDTATGNSDVTAETSASGTTVNSSGTCTDNAGNTAAGASFGPIKIDKTAPSITDLGPTSSPNGAGWYMADVTNRFKATDSLSGLDSACLTAYPAVSGDRIQSKTTSGEGTAVKVSSDSCSDEAGNTAAALDSAGFKIDKTAPSITDIGPTTSPNGAGWYKTDVVNDFKASDSLSGPNTACETAFPDVVTGGRKQSKTTTGEGSAIKVSSSACTDVAGNTAAAIDSAAFKIDTRAPTITDLGPTTSPNLAGWYKTDVTNRFKATDSLSGLDSDCLTAYPLDSGDRVQSKTTTGEGTAVKVSSDACSDEAGNTAAATDSAEFKVDKTGPTITDLGPTSSPNLAGWYKTDVVNDFKASDPLSGLSSTCLTAYPNVGGDRIQSKTTSGEGTAVKVSSDSCSDEAGNTAAAIDSAAFKVDKTAPSITDLGATTPPNLAGWYKTDVVNRFKASDSLSGPNSACETAFPDVLVDGRRQSKTTTGEGTDVKVSSDPCTDAAGNTAAAIDSAEFKVDKTAPTITDLGPTTDPNANGWYKTDVTNTFKASDSLSGLDSDCLTAYPAESGDRVQSKTTTGEGSAVTVNSDPCSDEAGNTAAALSSAEFKIDKTAPTITDLGPTTSPNLAGWYTTDVVNRFKASDPLSGLDSDCLTAYPLDSGDRVQSKTTTGEGTAVMVSSDACTDEAGNTAAAIDSAAFKVDKTAPSITDLGPTTSPNLAGWYKTDVVNRFKASDSLSGPNGACETAFPDVVVDGRRQSKTTSGEGTDVKVSSDPCTDVAGNTAAAIDSAAFKVDKTAPTIEDLGPTTDPNLAGWYKTDVVNEFKASDSLSGPNADCETAFPDVVTGGRKQSKTTTGEGTAVKVSSDACTDMAGNTAAAIDSDTFQIDKSDPTSHASSPNATNQATFTVDYTASDQAVLSGLERVELYVRTPEAGTGYVLAATDSTPSGSGSFNYTATAGEGTYRFYTVAYDVAGNVETSPVTYDAVTDVETGTPDTTTIYDHTAPVTTDNADDDWHNSEVTVTLTATDEDGGSGVDKTFYKVDGAATFSEGTSVVIGAPTDHSNDGTHTIYYYSTDKAGNEELTKQATVNIDTQAPSVAYTSAAPAANANGWRNVDVTATFTATDTLSGFPGPSSTKTDTATTSGEGSAVTVDSPAFTDRAGNTAAVGTAVSDPFKIDKTKPTLAPVVTPNPVTLGGTATVASNANDTLSTLDTQSCGALNTSTVGTKSVTCTATDKAGNSDSKTVNYSVQFGWNGFLQPINDTAHQTGLTQSRFKLGSTVPAKFVLRNAAGQIVQQATNPTFTRTNRLRACDANAVSEPLPGDILPDGGATYGWDGNQYHYNWSTKGIKDTGVYRIYANLADGTQRWVDICLW
jgi:large repetitive protein